MMFIIIATKYTLFFKKYCFVSKNYIYAALIEANHNKDCSVVKTLGSLVL